MATAIIQSVVVSNSCRQSLTDFRSNHSSNNNKKNKKTQKNNISSKSKNRNSSSVASRSEENNSIGSFCCSSRCCCLFLPNPHDKLSKVQRKQNSVVDEKYTSRIKYCLHKHLNRGSSRSSGKEQNKVGHRAGEAEAIKMTEIYRNGSAKKSPIMTSSTEKREHLYKILVIGELGTGKTSFIKRYVHQFFSQNYRATIGVDFALKVLHWDQNTIVRLQLWDIAGQERFGNMTRVYYKEAVGAFIVFDVTRSGTFDCVTKWKEDLDSKVQLPDGSPIPCILLANKCDQEKQGIITNAEKMDEYVKENGFAGWFETSAKENINIDESARALVNKILLNDKLISAADIADSEKFNIGGGSNGQTTGQTLKSKCSC